MKEETKNKRKTAAAKEKERQLSARVAFFYPLDIAPGEPEFIKAEEKYQEILHRRIKKTKHENCKLHPTMRLRDLGGVNIWRNAFTGSKEVTVSIRRDHWGNWEPANKTDNTYQLGNVGIIRDGVFVVDCWVLCNNLTPEQERAWDDWEKFRGAVLDHRRFGKPAQIPLFKLEDQ